MTGMLLDIKDAAHMHVHVFHLCDTNLRGITAAFAFDNERVRITSLSQGIVMVVLYNVVLDNVSLYLSL